MATQINNADNGSQFRSFVSGGLIFAAISLAQDSFEGGLSALRAVLLLGVVIGMFALDFTGGKTFKRATIDTVFLVSCLVGAMWIQHALHSFLAGVAFLFVIAFSVWAIRKTSGRASKEPGAGAPGASA